MRIVAGEAFCARYLFRREKVWYTEEDNSEFIYKDLLIKVKSQNKKIR